MSEMEEIGVEKAVVNIGVGDVGEDVEKAVDLLETLTGEQAVKTESTDAAQGFGKRAGLNLGAKVTLRGEKAEEFLERVFDAKNHEMDDGVFDTQGNFSVGVGEYIDMPDARYNPDIGMEGFDVAVVLERAGSRLKRRKEGGEVGKDQKVSEEEAKEFVKERFGVELV
ncbi:MAG: 50S ribosomal protein L5 [Candidatus Nanohaloarchaeota archaeon QJJ-7]|nr:50S ribosomal protein L5 [Candidatus Nanohaloarchaeota archaeon QJJ-7]